MKAFSDQDPGAENPRCQTAGFLKLILALFIGLSLCASSSSSADDIVLLRHEPSLDPASAQMKVDLSVRSPYPVSPLLYGKFTEHLGQNIYNGIDAQILTNPTFEKWAFSAGDSLINGGFKEETDLEKIKQQVLGQARWLVTPGPESLLADYQDGCAFGWRRLGPKASILLSPDVGLYGGRAQRIEIRAVPAGQSLGLLQPVYLPLHRTRRFQFRIIARSMAAARLQVGIAALDANGRTGEPLATQEVALEKNWAAVNGILSLPAGLHSSADAVFAFTASVSSPAHFVIDSLLLYPDDHVNHADPDVVRFYKDARLPLMRWPGGNFVSGYHWRDGIGPVDQRPTRPNPAWGALEYNLFGTDEFIALCKAIGCEPMICVNAGNGTPEEAAAWVEYCNGAPETPMGRLRSLNGHPAPYGVKYWEVGNEVYGRWQITWTTPDGYVDRYARFAAAMKAADPKIQLLACGNRDYRDNSWNLALVEAAGTNLRIVTDHILTGGSVTAETNPHELFQAFMGQHRQLGREYRDLRQRLESAGVKNPRLAITEAQLFARFTGKVAEGDPDALSPRTMPAPATISEALYDATLINESIRLGDFVEMFTHSATVNHGGGLEKRRERVFAHPCYYGHWMGRALAGGTPVAIELRSATYDTQHTFGQIAPMHDVPVLDAMAVLSPDGKNLTIIVIHRGSRTGPIALELDPGLFQASAEGEVLTLAGKTLYDRNTLEEPERIKPRGSALKLQGGKARMVIPPYSLTRLSLSKDSSR